MSGELDVVTLTGAEYDALRGKIDALEAQSKRLTRNVQTAWAEGYSAGQGVASSGVARLRSLLPEEEPRG
jgi:hypothetical protein